MKEREDRGFAYDGASASFEILARRMLGLMPRFFEVERYRVTVERRMNGEGRMVTRQRGGGGGALRAPSG